MQFEKFKSGRWVQQDQYKSFLPTTINHSWTWLDPSVNTLLEQASRALAELNTVSQMEPDTDADSTILMHIMKEATTSSGIEGIQTSMDEAIMKKEQIAPEKRDDWHETQNYIGAINHAIEELENIPLSNRLIKDTHKILMRGVRGEHKLPGEFRSSQNWIGGSNLNNAVFVPPHDSEVPDLMGDLEDFWHNEKIDVPDLIRVAISHYQFETIHPFLDGNGRIGRLMVILYLLSKKLLVKPALYLSDFFERNRADYYDALMAVRISNDMLHWVKFFLDAVLETANSGKDTFMKVIGLRREIETKILTLGRRAENAAKLIKYLYQNFIVSVSEVASQLGLRYPVANELVKKLEEIGILKEVTGYGRNRSYVLGRYLEIFRKPD